MLRFIGSAQRACDGYTRRDMLQIGALSALGVSLPDLFALDTAHASPAGSRARARACVLIYLFGGPSQLDTFDLKPDAPAHFRGEFRPIASSVAGIQICEHLPRLARQADKYGWTGSRNQAHPPHGWGWYYTLTAQRPTRPDLDAPPTPDDFPGLGALVSKLAPRRPGLPPAVTLPRWNRFLDLPNDYAGEKAGFLGRGFDPWLVKAGPGGQSFFPDGLELPLDVPPGRLTERRDLLAKVDRGIARWGESAGEHDALGRRAAELLSSPAVRAAFDLGREPDRLRDRYGRHPFGQALLLARRLVEAGSTLVQVNWHADGSDVKSPFWDTHKDNFNSLKNRLLPPLD